MHVRAKPLGKSLDKGFIKIALYCLTSLYRNFLYFTPTNLANRTMRQLVFVCIIGISYGTLIRSIYAQDRSADMFQAVSLEDASFFKDPGSNWQIVSSVIADIEEDYAFETKAGTSVLVNLPTEDDKHNLFTVMEHGDIDLELEFMMARHSNSGIYLQGRYEVQLLDSWGKSQPTFGDCGGIYERWDDSQPEGEEGYEGYAPRINAALAPGVWQKLFISFQAPRFDASGNKVKDARIIRLELNGITLHENLILTGPTRGPAFAEEASKGPIMIQGDHGPVAFRNIRYRLFEPITIDPQDLAYKVYRGKYDELPNVASLNAAYSGEMEVLTQEVVEENDQFILQVSGKLDIPNPGLYQFHLIASGNGQLKVGDQIVVDYGWWNRSGNITLEAGIQPFEILYHKRDSWYPNGLGLEMEGPQLRVTPLHQLSSIPLTNPTDPIYIQTDQETRIVRCFVDYPEAGSKLEHRIVHAINVGSPEGVHYTYDADRASLAMTWRGPFMDATPMWDNRGDGSARSRGVKLVLGDQPPIASASSTSWPDTMSADTYRFGGYEVDNHNAPTFHYQLNGTNITDQIRPDSSGKYLTRKLTFSESDQTQHIYRITSGEQIQQLEKDLYLIDHQYYIKVIDGKVKLEDQGEKETLTHEVSVKGGELTYHIIY